MNKVDQKLIKRFRDAHAYWQRLPDIAPTNELIEAMGDLHQHYDDEMKKRRKDGASKAAHLRRLKRIGSL